VRERKLPLVENEVKKLEVLYLCVGGGVKRGGGKEDWERRRVGQSIVFSNWVGGYAYLYQVFA